MADSLWPEPAARPAFSDALLSDPPADTRFADLLAALEAAETPEERALEEPLRRGRRMRRALEMVGYDPRRATALPIDRAEALHDSRVRLAGQEPRP